MSDQWMIDQDSDGSWRATLRGAVQASFPTSAAALDYVQMMKGIKQPEPETPPAPAKIKRITVVIQPAHYAVLQVTNSMEYYPGQLLAKPLVADLCSDPNWEVTIVVP